MLRDKVDLDKINLEKDITMAEIHNVTARRIITIIMKKRNELLSTGKDYRDVIVGFDVYEHIIMLPGFVFSSFKYVNNNNLHLVGSIMGIQIFLEPYKYLKNNEFEYFWNTEELIKTIIYSQRIKKLSRILNE